MRIVFKQKGFDAIKRDSDGFKRLPGGDYSEVDFRGEGRYVFDDWSFIGDFKDLGNETTIGKWATIGNGTKIGNETTIGKWVTIGDGTKIGNETKIGNGTKIGSETTIGDRATIGNGTTIGNGSTIGKWATIGEFFIYGKNTTFEGGAVKNGRYVKVGQIGRENREAYFFIDENGKFFVRAGCWFGDMERFIEHVKCEHGGTLFEKQYLAACEYARAVLPGMLEEAR